MTRPLHLFILWCIAALLPLPEAAAGDIVPRTSITQTRGTFTFTEDTRISVQDAGQEAVARYFSGMFSAPCGFTPEIVRAASGEKAEIRFIGDPALKDEAYRLDISGSGIDVRAGSPAGFFYAVQTIRMMLPPEIEETSRAAAQWCIPAGKIEDSPKFSYRGLMLDVSRHFVPKEDVMKIIDCMAMLKLNTLHWHLTDGNGWRIEIKKYPALTEVGAWSVDRSGIPFPDRRNQRPGEKATTGGFYTQDDIREIVAYAAERQVEIIPEIDMPAHANAALAAYPELACPVAPKPVTVIPGMGEGEWDIIFCAGNDKVFSFIDDVMDELMELFPSEYIHIGGDEAQKTIWAKCPLCQERIREHGLKDEEALQGYFMGRVADYLRSKGKTVIGWDELVRSELPEGAVICGWQGDGRSAFKAASLGHRFIMTPAKTMYFIRYQGPQWFEPRTYFGNITLKDVYEYDYTENAGWKPEYSSLMMGMQACMWTEFCQSTDDVTYLLFPRLAAFSELVWCPEEKMDWEGFLPRLDSFLGHLDAKGIVYVKSMYNIQHTSTPSEDGTVEVKLECIRPDVEIRCTTDGTEPSAESPLYTAPLKAGKATVIKCATFFKDGSQAGQTLTLPLVWNKATGQKVSGNGSVSVLTNGVRGSLRESDFEWATWISGQDAEIVLDLGKETPLENITVGCLTNYGMGVHKPSVITVETSADGKDFSQAGTRTFSHEEIFREGNFTEDITFPVDGISARYIKVKATGAGNCPADHVRPGQAAKFCFDEIMAE